jgi:hypothetical protein
MAGILSSFIASLPNGARAVFALKEVSLSLFLKRTTCLSLNKIELIIKIKA